MAARATSLLRGRQGSVQYRFRTLFFFNDEPLRVAKQQQAFAFCCARQFRALNIGFCSPNSTFNKFKLFFLKYAEIMNISS
jgi:hypothetical protein